MSNIVSITTGATYRTSRTNEEINAELSRLAKLREIVTAHSAFGDDNHAAIDATMRVLGERMSTEDVSEELDRDDVADYILSEALNAAHWLRGHVWLEGQGAAPSEGWLNMAGDEARVN